ncbi:MAG: phenylalanine--tRNA ligase beta subunit-related protein [Candidatus Bathyarchaeia archaeon]
MEPFLSWSAEASARFPNLLVCTGVVRDVKVEHDEKRMDALKQSILTRARQNYKIEQLKDDAIVRAYRDLYWSLGIDPTKTRPSGEALLRRTLHGNDIPAISNVVDAYNLASLETIIPLSGFDLDKIKPPLRIRFSNEADEFRGIGMSSPVKLITKVLLVADENQILCIYPYRDADATKITEQTRNVLIIGYGAPTIPENQLVSAVEKALTYIENVAGGVKETVNVFLSSPQHT